MSSVCKVRTYSLILFTLILITKSHWWYSYKHHSDLLDWLVSDKTPYSYSYSYSHRLYNQLYGEHKRLCHKKEEKKEEGMGMRWDEDGDVVVVVVFATRFLNGGLMVLFILARVFEDVGCWVLSVGCWVLSVGCWVLIECWCECWVLGAEGFQNLLPMDRAGVCLFVCWLLG